MYQHILLITFCISLTSCSYPDRHPVIGRSETEEARVDKFHHSTSSENIYYDIKKLRRKYPNDFLGLGVAHSQTEAGAKENAELLAKADLVDSIKLYVEAFCNYYESTSQIRSISYSLSHFEESIRLYSDEYLRDPVFSEARTVFIDSLNQYKHSVVARRNRQLHFGDYMRLRKHKASHRKLMQDFLLFCKEQ